MFSGFSATRRGRRGRIHRRRTRYRVDRSVRVSIDVTALPFEGMS